MSASPSTRIEHWINGRSTPGTGERRGEVYNPATGATTGHVAFAADSDVDAAIDAAAQAFPAWSATPAHVRARVMFRFRDLLEANRDRLSEIIVAEHGKVFNDAQGEVTRGMEVVEFACGISQLLKGEYS
ncbi:Aldehyde dehydrogenase family protein [Saccharopolyspora flava]|uniref:Aldehyde dehydrogenase family protein n=1 Tax=Saccharopolyspora flava TaxID=95161 RepID=A0A1I6RMQ8_9PSEU|nr:Aldehyde dehydrogenase family protein [Saccharopolyspora flava]